MSVAFHLNNSYYEKHICRIENQDAKYLRATQLQCVLSAFIECLLNSNILVVAIKHQKINASCNTNEVSGAQSNADFFDFLLFLGFQQVCCGVVNGPGR